MYCTVRLYQTGQYISLHTVCQAFVSCICTVILFLYGLLFGFSLYSSHNSNNKAEDVNCNNEIYSLQFYVYVRIISPFIPARFCETQIFFRSFVPVHICILLCWYWPCICLLCLPPWTVRGREVDSTMNPSSCIRNTGNSQKLFHTAQGFFLEPIMSRCKPHNLKFIKNVFFCLF